MAVKQSWAFKSQLRSGAFGWKGSHLACQRLQEAVIEIRKVAKIDSVWAGEGIVALMERIWPAFQHVDTSSGALGSAVNGTQSELLPILAAATADPKTREAWLTRLWQAINEDGVEYLSMVGDQWGELCHSREIASHWADQLLSVLRTAWSDPRPSNYVRGTSVCLSSLVAAGRTQELLDLLALQRFPFWHDRQFGWQALLREGRIDEALDYAEASRGLNQPDRDIDAACESTLLGAGRVDAAYLKYALTANISTTGLATFRTIAKKYPGRDHRNILLDLAASSGDPGRWFAAAKSAGFLDLALEFATTGQTDPRTLSRASRGFLQNDAAFCLQVGRLALKRILAGHGYELTALDALAACDHFLAAAHSLGCVAQSRQEILTLASNASGAVFSDLLLRKFA